MSIPTPQLAEIDLGVLPMAGPVMSYDTVYEVSVKGRGKDLGRIDNVQHLRFVDTIVANLGDLHECLNNWALFWQAFILPNCSVHYEVLQYTIKEINGWSFIGPNKAIHYGMTAVLAGNGGTDVGGIITDGLPNYVAFTVQKKTSTAGRRYRGSMRVGGVVEADTDENTLQPAAITWMTAAADELINNHISVNVADTEFIDWCVFSKTNLFADATLEFPAVGLVRSASKVVTGKIVNLNVGSQTSRKVRN